MSYKGFFALQTLKYLCSPPSHPAAHLQLRQSGILLLEAHCHGRHPLHVAVGQHLPRVWVGQAFRTMGFGVGSSALMQQEAADCDWLEELAALLAMHAHRPPAAHRCLQLHIPPRQF